MSQSQGQGATNPDNPNNEPGKPGYDASQPTLTADDPNYTDEQGGQDRGRPGGNR